MKELPTPPKSHRFNNLEGVSSQNDNIDDSIRRNFVGFQSSGLSSSSSSIVNQNQNEGCVVPAPRQRVTNHGASSKPNIKPPNSVAASNIGISKGDGNQRLATMSQNLQQRGQTSTVGGHPYPLSASHSNEKADQNMQHKQQFRNTGVSSDVRAVSNSNSVQNKGKLSGNQSQNQRFKHQGKSNDCQLNVKVGHEKSPPENTVGTRGNGNRRQQRAKMWQASEQREVSGSSDVVRGRRDSSTDYQSNGTANPNMKQQSFRNMGASDQSERRNANRGQFHGDRNQRAENHDRNKGQSVATGNSHRRQMNNQPT